MDPTVTEDALKSGVDTPEPTHSEEDTKSALSEMFGRGLVYTAVFALQSAALIVITPLTVRHLSKYQFGRFVTVSTLAALLIAVLGFGFGTSIQRLHAEDDGDFRKTRGLLGLGIAMALLATILVSLTGPLWAPILRVGAYGGALKFGVWSAGLAAIALMISYWFRSADRLGPFLLVMAPLAVGSQIAGFAFILWITPTASAYLAGVCVGELVAVLLGVVLAKPRLLGPSQRHIALAALAMSLPLVLSGIAYQTLNLGDRIVVQHVMGQFQVGRYQLAYNTSALVMLALMLLSVAWLPKIFAIKDLALRKAVLAQSRDELYQLLVPLIVGISFAAPLALKILAPPSYRTGQLLFVVSLVAISAIPFSAYLASSRVLIAFGKTRSLMWICPLAAVANVLLNILLVPHWGLNASAFATLLGYGILAWMAHASAQRVARLERTPPGIWIFLAVASCISIGTAYLPISSGLLIGRFLISVVCGAWVIVGVVDLIKGTSRSKFLRRSALAS